MELEKLLQSVKALPRKQTIEDIKAPIQVMKTDSEIKAGDMVRYVDHEIKMGTHTDRASRLYHLEKDIFVGVTDGGSTNIRFRLIFAEKSKEINMNIAKSELEEYFYMYVIGAKSTGDNTFSIYGFDYKGSGPLYRIDLEYTDTVLTKKNVLKMGVPLKEAADLVDGIQYIDDSHYLFVTSEKNGSYYKLYVKIFSYNIATGRTTVVQSLLLEDENNFYVVSEDRLPKLIRFSNGNWYAIYCSSSIGRNNYGAYRISISDTYAMTVERKTVVIPSFFTSTYHENQNYSYAFDQFFYCLQYELDKDAESVYRIGVYASGFGAVIRLVEDSNNLINAYVEMSDNLIQFPTAVTSTFYISNGNVRPVKIRPGYYVLFALCGSTGYFSAKCYFWIIDLTRKHITVLDYYEKLITGISSGSGNAIAYDESSENIYAIGNGYTSGSTSYDYHINMTRKFDMKIEKVIERGTNDIVLGIARTDSQNGEVEVYQV